MSATEKPTPRHPSDETIAASKAAFRSLSPLAHPSRKIQITVREGKRVALEDVVIPGPAMAILVETLKHLSEGESVALLPSHRELTTQEAADLLNVSRPFVIQLLESGKIPHRMVGTHRRVALQDLLAYKKADDAERTRVLEELTRESEKLGLY